MGYWCFTSLLSLNMSRNSLGGAIPTSIGELRAVNVLDLSENQLNGSIPSQIGGAVFLKELKLQNNHLAGNLPVQIGKCSSLTPLALALSGGDDFSRSPTTDANSGKLVMFSGDPDFSAGAHALLNKDCELDGWSQEEFEREVKKLGKIRHRNLVMLEGYYWTQSLQLLIYEFVPCGSLYKHLHEGPSENILSWHDRFNIILGTAKSLAHLHQMNVIHYNLKSSNVLIDSSGEPKVGDFGLARLLPMLDRYVLSSKIQSDWEVVTGKLPVEYMEDDVVVLCDMGERALEEREGGGMCGC
ncbi:hypothetical protein IFM89_018710 [Coptis chinensis]|uniref:Protein kinase domain-containing protein n=1 Tax=Coptis chinensis TaxID=261450 RepID=A0A835ID98_9MAGN|nr:hypothetical protein IFM89_018710 [Coptis chinensis]